LNGLLGVSQAASLAFTTDVTTALVDRNAKSGILAEAVSNQTQSNTAKIAADLSLDVAQGAVTDATSIFNTAVLHHTAMVTELNDKQPGVDAESETLRSTIVLIESLIPESGCHKDLFSHAKQIGYDLYCFNAASYPHYVTQSDGQTCTSSCKTLDGVESAVMCHDVVKNSDCGATAFVFREGASRCWAKSGMPDPTASSEYIMGMVQSGDCATDLWEVKTGQSCSGRGDAILDQGYNLDTCKSTCIENTECGGFVFSDLKGPSHSSWNTRCMQYKFSARCTDEEEQSGITTFQNLGLSCCLDRSCPNNSLVSGATGNYNTIWMCYDTYVYLPRIA